MTCSDRACSHSCACRNLLLQLTPPRFGVVTRAAVGGAGHGHGRAAETETETDRPSMFVHPEPVVAACRRQHAAASPYLASPRLTPLPLTRRDCRSRGRRSRSPPRRDRERERKRSPSFSPEARRRREDAELRRKMYVACWNASSCRSACCGQSVRFPALRCADVCHLS